VPSGYAALTPEAVIERAGIDRGEWRGLYDDLVSMDAEGGWPSAFA
jgi:hypothetical protein